MPASRQTKGGQDNEEAENISRLVQMSHRTERFIDQRDILFFLARKGGATVTVRQVLAEGESFVSRSPSGCSRRDG
jgi:hypothetical protein